MGEAFISNKKKWFEHKREQEYQSQLASPDLMTRLIEVTTTVYKCTLKSRSISLHEGEGVLVADLGEANVTVLRSNEVIGYVQPRDSEKIRAFFANSPHKMAVGHVHSLPRLGKTFSITLEF